jgi:hypothetical protein
MWLERHIHYNTQGTHNTFAFVEQKEQAAVPPNTNTLIWQAHASSCWLVAMNGTNPERNVMFIYSCGRPSTWYKDCTKAGYYNEWAYMRPRALLTPYWLQLSNTPLSAIKISILITNIAMEGKIFASCRNKVIDTADKLFCKYNFKST